MYLIDRHRVMFAAAADAGTGGDAAGGVEAGAAAAAAQAAADARALGQDPAPPAPQRTTGEADTDTRVTAQAWADARLEHHRARELLTSRFGSSIDADVATFAAAFLRGDPRATHAARVFNANEVAKVPPFELGQRGSILASMGAAGRAIDNLEQATRDEAERLAKVNADGMLSERGAAAEREKIRKATDRAPAWKSFDQAAKPLDSRAADLMKGLEKLGEAAAVPEAQAGHPTLDALLRAASLPDDQLANLSTRALAEGHAALALQALDVFALVARDPLKLKAAARQVRGRVEAVREAALLGHAERVEIVAELHALDQVRRGLAELRRDAERRPSEISQLRQRHAKVYDTWMREK